MICNLSKLDEGKEGKRELVTIIMQNFKSTLNQIWVNRCKKFYEWEQIQGILRKHKHKNKFVTIYKTKIGNYKNRKIELKNSIKINVDRSVKFLLTSINNFSFDVDNGRT